MICPFITDVYEVARMLLSQTDVELVQVKDYIREPKENGYRSLHLIVKLMYSFRWNAPGSGGSADAYHCHEFLGKYRASATL